MANDLVACSVRFNAYDCKIWADISLITTINQGIPVWYALHFNHTGYGTQCLGAAVKATQQHLGLIGRKTAFVNHPQDRQALGVAIDGLAGLLRLL